MRDLTVNRFRAARGRVLQQQIRRLSEQLGRPITILDIGGRPDYWENVGFDNIGLIRLLNIDRKELERPTADKPFRFELGDARCLSDFDDNSVDLVHSNSLIEHVGLWSDMCAVADEALRVGVSGWMQTPAWEFPIEPHYRLPFLHWFAAPLRRKMLTFSRDYRSLDTKGRRYHVDRINLLSRHEVVALFPECDIFVERVIFPKSYSARWGPAGTV
jgi:hypothetical protein